MISQSLKYPYLAGRYQGTASCLPDCESKSPLGEAARWAADGSVLCTTNTALPWQPHLIRLCNSSDKPHHFSQIHHLSRHSTPYLQLTIPSHFPALTQGFLWELFLSFVQGAQLFWGDLTVPFVMAQCSQGSGWTLGAAPEHTVPGSAIPRPQGPSQPSRPRRYETVGSVFLGVSLLLGGRPSWPGPVL